LDEFFGQLDAVNRQLIAKAIKWIAAKFDFKKILIISHEEELQDTCDNVINVIFDGRKSYVQS
jgi:DNA repair exonuclease SbcCD ATPase subunit